MNDDIRKIKEAGDIFQKEFYDLYQSHLDLNEIFDICKMWIFIKDLKNNLITVNQYYAEKLGVTKEQVLNTPCEAWFDDYEDFGDADGKLIKTQKPVLGAIEHASRRGTKYVFRTDKYPLFNKKGDLEAILGIAIELGPSSKCWECHEVDKDGQ